jgi:hypothetical protein
MAEASGPVTRLSVMAALFGCWKVTLAPAPREKFCQLRIAFWLDCVMRVLVALGVAIVAEPAITDAPDGILG